jgi:hypothetical protein
MLLIATSFVVTASFGGETETFGVSSVKIGASRMTVPCSVRRLDVLPHRPATSIFHSNSPYLLVARPLLVGSIREQQYLPFGQLVNCDSYQSSHLSPSWRINSLSHVL